MALVGLRNIHYAVITADTSTGTTYDTPKKIGNAVSVDINPSTQKAVLYGDDSAVATATSMGEVTVTLETTDIPLEDQAILLGATFDSVNNTILSKSSDVAPYVGIAFESEKHDGGIRCVKLLKGKFAPSQETISTKREQVEYTVPKIEGAFVARQSDRGWKTTKDVATGTDTADWYATF
ncbi:MAG: hypothetical protein IJQ82_11855 [Selenomonadaceae bacterium]|nr:hypothetical protein [Selenomonadaceae bacterium]